ncbi:FadR family transcriptional regulator [Cryobacterium levicorallinum]|uniref:FadR family transcriptional regulator n=1 Tax=Cryobacterium levicorallinum TaxID=995038 RepID=A0A1I3AP77_9MICO|nr:FCD domain-containing protein [Cryobacterium levicorallinum]TFB88058.1 FadR family transcriptional regulator [Cryobacterium levicorallinum]GEP26742.1 GntR family transcriptional regulator [Cryobacterium levicorallinum]SFH51844.1 GntR family transcriptional regulator, transcriptional repressor for pyruvate dehydrogenase complex [Cryobacterium levicorallinum]
MTPQRLIPQLLPEPLGRVSRPRLYEQLVEQLLGYIESAQLGPGDLLPSERDLAERLGVSRPTLVQALVALEVLGVIDVRHGTGAVLVYRPSIATVIKGLQAHQNRLPEIVEARSTLEIKLASLAALRRTDADLAAIDAALTSMAAEIADGQKGALGDELFHQAVTAAAHSAVLGQLMTFIAEMILETRLESLGQPGRPEQSLASHRAIAAAIRSQDADAAAAKMLAHIELVSDVALLK